MIDGLEGTERVLAVAAHPDDLDYGCGGTLGRLADAGAAVHQLILTVGESGSSDPDMTRERLRGIRRNEAAAAAAVLGCGITVLDYEDGRVVYSDDLRRDISREIRRHRPDLVLCMDPRPILGGWFINHPDHRFVAQATLDSLITGGPTRLLHPELLTEGLEPWKPTRVLLYGPGDDVNFVVDIAATLDRKAEALACHGSQTGHIDAHTVVTGMARADAKDSDFEFGESFHLFDVAP